jgi:HrpA-like RNA helicase
MISPPAQEFIDSALHNLYANGAITSKEADGVITPLGRAYSAFSGLSVPMARAIIASYYYHCKYDVIPIMVIIANIDGRIDGLYEKFRPRGKMSKNSKEYMTALKEFEKKQHQFDSSSGDFMTIYNIYQAFRSFMRIPKTLMPEGNIRNQPMNGGANNNNNKNNGTNNVPSVIPIEQLTKKTSQDARRWCIENGISPRVFVDSRNKTSWDKVGNEVRKIENTLMKVVQPPVLRRTYFALY